MEYDFLNGVGVALVTFFDENDKIDFDSLKKLFEHVTRGKVSYILLHGTTGEAATTSLEEKRNILKFINQINEKRVPIVLGIGGNNTKEILNQFDKYNLDHIKAILSVCPYYNKPTQKGIYNHYNELSKKSPVPIIIYNVPSRTGINITASTTIELSQIPNIIGVKESSGNFEQSLNISKYKSDSFKLICGNDIDTVPMMSIGASGVISVLANAFPLHFSNIVKYCFESNYIKATKTFFDLMQLDKLMYEEGNPVGIKQLLECLFIGNSNLRLPLDSASSKLKSLINNNLKSLKFD